MHVRRRVLQRVLVLLLISAMALATACQSQEQPRQEPSPPASSTNGTATSMGEVSSHILKSMDTVAGYGTYPGMLTLIRIGDETKVLTRGVAAQDREEPLTRQHRFRIGSITKPIVAALVLQQIESGRLRLSDPVSRWLPGLLSDGSHITIKHLLTHSSGLFDFTGLPGFDRMVRRLPADPVKLVKLANAQGSEFAPGQGAAYSNTNFIVLGLIVERITGQHLARTLETKIFRPLRMASSSLDWAHADDPPLAHGYSDDQDVTASTELAWAWSAGGVVSTAEDVSRFFRALLRGDIIGHELLEEMTSPLTEGVAEWRYYGLGLAQVETTCGSAHGHSGTFPGFMAEAWTLDTLEREVVVMVNRYDDQTSQARLVRIIEQALCD
jgi:D-alanyl-D-alanine carboxypeptidase